MKIAKKMISLIIIMSMIITFLSPFQVKAQSDDTLRKSAGTVRTPALLPGMTAVYWEGDNPVELEAPYLNKEKWYDYSSKRWANARTEDGSYWVWIPTYAYRIGYYEDSAKTKLRGYRLNNKFVNANGTEVKNPNDVKSKYMKIETKFIAEDGSDLPEGYTIHPSFYKEGLMSNGFWIAKYMARGDNAKFANDPSLSEKVNISVSDAFDKLDKSSLENNPYGFTDEFVKVGLPRATELGAVQYLAASSLGINQDTVDISSVTMPTLSSTGNITGVCDLNKGIREWTSSYINNGSANIAKNGAKLQQTNTAQVGERDIPISAKTETYAYYTGADPTYAKTIKEAERHRFIHYGDGIYETTHPMGEEYSALAEGQSIYPYADEPFIVKGSGQDDTVKSMFSYNRSTGAANPNIGYRAVAYIFPKVAQNYINIKFTTPEGEIIHKKGSNVTSYGREVMYKRTKGSHLMGEFTVEKASKKFLRWEPNVDGMPLYKDLEVRPVFEGSGTTTPDEEFTVTFQDQVTSKVYLTGKVKKGETAKSLADTVNPVKDGYDFAGWTPDINQAITSDKVFYATWIKGDEPTVPKFKVKFVVGGVSEPFDEQLVEKNGYAKIPETNPKLPKKIFVGWTPDPKKTTIDRDRTFIAMFKDEIDPPVVGETVDLIVDLDGGTSSTFTNGQRIKVAKGSRLTDPVNATVLSLIMNDTPTKPANKFIKWEVDTNNILEKDTVLKAVWQERTYRYRFIDKDLFGGIRKIYKEGFQTYGKSVEEFLPPAPEKEGFKFIGWSPSVTDGYSYNVDFEAKWSSLGGNTTTDETVTIRFDLDGGSWSYDNEIVIGKNTYLPTLPIPTKADHQFIRWEGGDLYMPQANDTTYKAVWYKVTRPGGFTKPDDVLIYNPGNSPTGSNQQLNTQGTSLQPVNNLDPTKPNSTEFGYTQVPNQTPGGVITKTKRDDYPHSGSKRKWLLIIMAIVMPIILVNLITSLYRLRDISTKKK